MTRHRAVSRSIATTLAELLLAVAIVFVLLGMVLSLWRTGIGRGERVDFQLEAARSMAQLLSLLEDDLAHLLPGSRQVTKWQPDPVRLVTLARVPAGRASGPGGLPVKENMAPMAESVTWLFDPSSGRLMRNGSALPAGPFADVRFTYAPAGADHGDLLTIEVTAVPLGADPKNPGTPRVTRKFTRNCTIATINHLAEEWAGP